MESYRIKNLTFTYPGKSEPTLYDLNFTIEAGRFVTLCGPSGCGKTTLLRRLKPSFAPHGDVSGEIYFEGTPTGVITARDESTKIGFVMQSPENQIVTDKVWHELAFGLESLGFDTETIRLRVADLSGGEQQRAALAKALLLRPRILLLDEPTKGLDAEFKIVFAGILRELTASGVTVVMVSHDVEFCAEYTDRCAMFFDGSVVTESPSRKFFSGNSFYTSAANRMARNKLPEAITARDVITALGGSVEPPAAKDGGRTADILYTEKTAPPPLKAERKLELWRKVLMTLAATG